MRTLSECPPETLRRLTAVLCDMVRQHWRSPQQRKQDQAKLKSLAMRILKAVPGADIASDQAYRDTDLAIDFREDVAPLEMEQVERVVRMFEAAGATAKISPIHVNGWFGDFDKLAMTRLMLQEVFSIDIDSSADTIAFVGDSPNDAPIFSFFPNAVGVANVQHYADTLACLPRWITQNCGGFGFAEFADDVVAAKA